VALHLVEDLLACNTKKGRVIPWGLGDEVMERLVTGRQVERVHTSRERLDALAFAR
jgi:hypothetical protein